MKIQSIKQAGSAVDAARDYYAMRIRAAADAAGTLYAVANAIGANRTALAQALQSRNVGTLRRYAEQIDKAGL